MHVILRRYFRSILCKTVRYKIGLPDIQDFVGLEREFPLGVGFDVADAGGEVAGVVVGVVAVAGLQVVALSVGGTDVVEAGDVLGMVHVEDDFQFIDALYCRHDAEFGRDGYPADARDDGVVEPARSVSLDVDEFSGARQRLEERFGELQCGLASGKDDMLRRIAADAADDFRLGHLDAMLVVGVAEVASEIAAREADKDSWRPCEASLALKGVENLVDFHSAAPLKESSTYAAMLPSLSCTVAL